MPTFEEHIDAFLQGELEGEARKAFLLELERDPDKMKALEEHTRLNRLLKENARTAAVPLHAQRALAQRIPVLQKVDPRLAPTAAQHAGTGASSTGSGSGLLTSGVVRSLKILSAIGVAVVGSWYGVTQLGESSATAEHDALQKPIQENVQTTVPPQQPAAPIADPAETRAKATQSATADGQTSEGQNTDLQAAIADPHTRAGEQAVASGNSAPIAQSSVAESSSRATNATPAEPAGEVDASGVVGAIETSTSPVSKTPESASPGMAASTLATPPAIAEPVHSSNMNAMPANNLLTERALVVYPVQAVMVPFRDVVPAEVVVDVNLTLIDELAPEVERATLVGYFESGASGSELMLTGFGNAGTNMYGTYVIGLQYNISERLRFGAEFGRSPYSRQTIALVPVEQTSLDAISLFRREAGVSSELKSWLQLHGEYVINPDDAIQLQAIGGFGSVFDTRFVPSVTFGTAAGYELFPSLLLRAGLYFNGAWMPANLAAPQFVGTPGQPIGIITTGETVGTTFSSSVDVRIGLGLKLW